MQRDEERKKDEPVGKSVMDAEHELLHRLLDELKEELESGGSRIPELLDRFDDVARAHFLEEQSLMRLHAYPGYEAHQNEHDELIEELRGLADRIEKGGAADAARLAGELEDWFTVHMRTTDAALEEYLRQEGIRPPAVALTPDARARSGERQLRRYGAPSAVFPGLELLPEPPRSGK